MKIRSTKPVRRRPMPRGLARARKRTVATGAKVGRRTAERRRTRRRMKTFCRRRSSCETRPA